MLRRRFVYPSHVTASGPAASPITDEETDHVVMGDAHSGLLHQLAVKMSRGIGEVLHIALRQLAVKHRVITTHEAKQIIGEDKE